MKKSLSFIILLLAIVEIHGQPLTVDKLFSVGILPQLKFDKYLSGIGFIPIGKENIKDSLITLYDYRRSRKFSNIDSIRRSIIRKDIKDNTLITFNTVSLTEYSNLKLQLKNKGFFCNREDVDSPSIYQNKDLSVVSSVYVEDTTKWYSLQFHKKIFPKAKDIYYADDLLTFTSHEYLVHYFGEKNVKKDIYFLSGNEIAKCSVLFLNTNRQVVFIWEDEENRCTISNLLFGGQQNLKSSQESGRYIEENHWALKSGIRPGMSLAELRLLNGDDFRFYGGNSVNSGSVIADNKGKLDFKKESIILGCLNCRDEKFTMANVIHADDSLDEGRILFVLSVIINP